MKEMKASRPLNPLSDVFIRYLLGSEKNIDLLMDFINAVLEEKGFPAIVELEIINPFNLRSTSFSKESIVDIKAKDSRGRYINVEVQIEAKLGFEQRSLYYWANIYQQQLKSGHLYTRLKPTICINLLNSIIFPELKGYHSCFHITEKDQSEFVLSDDLQIHFIEIPKLTFHKESEIDDRLKLWCYYLEMEGFLEEEDMPVLLKKDMILNKARREYTMFTADQEKMEIAEAREKWLKDYNTAMDQARKEGLSLGIEQGIEQGIERGIEQGLEKGIEQGLEKGIERGVEQGRDQGMADEKIKIARQMIKMGLDLSVIISATGLDEQTLKKL